MSEIIKLKERKPTFDYLLNDLAFLSLKTKILYGNPTNQDRFDFDYQLKLKDKEIERLQQCIKEALILTEHTRFEEQYASDEILLPILNKLKESGISNYIKVEGSDTE